MSPLTIEHIAALAGVSRSTVSRVVNDDPRVSPEARARVQRVIAERGYTPRAAARSLAGRRTGVVCLLNVRDPQALLAGEYTVPLVQGISGACHDLEHFLLLSIVTPNEAPALCRRLVRGRHCDGVIVLASDAEPALLSQLVADGAPLVLIGEHPEFPQLSSVDVENARGARLAVEHLLALGHRRVATITGPLRAAHCAERLEGYAAALRDSGLPVRPELVAEGDLTAPSGEAAMARLLTVRPRPTAVFAADDAMAAGALRTVRAAGLDVPQDVALVGFDDAPIASLTDPPLTTVRQPVQDLGAAAARLLLEQVRERAAAPVRRRLPVELVVRGSSGDPLRPAAAAD
jgi:LacI family transcriptional regulator